MAHCVANDPRGWGEGTVRPAAWRLPGPVHHHVDVVLHPDTLAAAKFDSALRCVRGFLLAAVIVLHNGRNGDWGALKFSKRLGQLNAEAS